MFDREGDLLGIGQIKLTKGFFRDVGDDIFVRVSHEGKIVGFVIHNLTKRMTKIRDVKLPVEATSSKTNELP